MTSKPVTMISLAPTVASKYTPPPAEPPLLLTKSVVIEFAFAPATTARATAEKAALLIAFIFLSFAPASWPSRWAVASGP